MTPLLGLALAALLQGAEVTATVDRTRLTVGEEVLLTVRARTRSAEPLQLLLPPLAGFAIVGSRDLTEVSMSGTGAAVRTTVRELQLRAEQAGALLIGPVRVRQGQSSTATDPILVTVDSAATGIATALSPLARALLETAPAPRSPDDVALTIIVPDDTVVIGQQVDLIAAAWIPRSLRERMRRPPLLTLVTPEGVWAYPPSTPAGVVAQRVVGGRPMDLFVTHQIVFPLAAGAVTVPPATVEYAVPVTFSFFSREERYELRSDSVKITVLSLPAGGGGGRSADDRGVVGQGLTLDLTIEPAATRVGEPIEAATTVTGVGNVALWPEPVVRWPPGFRAYPAQTEMRLAPQQGRMAGSKTFRFLAVPDSAGTFVLPDVRYPYFDVVAGRYEVAAAAPRGLAVAPGAEPRAARALPPLLARRDEPVWERLGRRLDGAGWIALVLGPPFAAWLLRRRRRAAAPASPDGAGDRAPTRLGRLEHEFLAVLASHVSDAFARDGDGLAQALRAAGIDSAVADHVKRLRDRLRAARYGPRGLGDAAELAEEIEQVLRVLGAESGGGGGGGPRRRHRILVTLLLLLAAAPRLQAQTPSAEALYEAGALRAAADSFAARAAHEPTVAAHWYNLGATLYRAGADGKATAAWTRAARLAPRDPVIRRARRLLPAPDAASEQLLVVGWATPREWGSAALVAWAALWVVALGGLQRRRALLVVLAAAALGAAVGGAAEWRRRARPLAVVVAGEAPVHTAPYGAASAAVSVRAGGALFVGRRYGAWVEVRRSDGVRGWVLGQEVAPL